MANSQKLYSPGPQNSPFGLVNTNPQGSNYQGDAISALESNLIEKAIKEAIFDAAPKQFDALKLAFAQAPIEKGSDEFEYLETGFGRNALEIDTPVGGASNGSVTAFPGAQVTQTYTLTTASLDYVSIDLLITYPDGTEGVIQSITGTTSL